MNHLLLWFDCSIVIQKLFVDFSLLLVDTSELPVFR